MKKRRYTEYQIIGILKQHEAGAKPGRRRFGLDRIVGWLGPDGIGVWPSDREYTNFTSTACLPTNQLNL
jgi:hypothetical protein